MAERPPEDYYVNILLKKTKIKDVMATPVIKIYVDEKCSRAEQLFVDKRVYYLPVVDRSDHLVGIITHKYLYKTQSPRKIISPDMNYDPNLVVDGHSFYDKDTLDRYTLADIMYKTPFTLSPEDTIAEAILAMAERNIGCIPIITGNGKVGGIITSKDIVAFAATVLKDYR